MAKQTELEKDQAILTKWASMWAEASEDRKHSDWKWYLYSMWVRGYHYASYNEKTKQITSVPPKDGRPKIVINKIYPTLRSVRNYVLRNQPKAQVTPENLTADSLDQALKATKFLEFIHETAKLRPKLKGSVFQALECSVAWWQIVWDGDKIAVNPIDVFDYYPDPKARTAQEQRYGIVAVARRIDDLLDDPKYIKEEVQQLKPDNRQSASSYKELLLSKERKTSGLPTEAKKGTIIVKEYWYLDNGKVFVGAEAGGRMIRKPEVVDSPIIPVFKLPADVMPFSMYGEGWVKNMIDPQKMLNSAASSVAEYNLIMNKVKVITDKGSGLRAWNNQHGQFVEVKRGFRAETVPAAPMNSAIFEQINMAERFIEDIGAMHDASKGRIPSGAKSGKAIEALQVGDSNNMSELVENIEDFLEDVYEYILWIASRKYQDLTSIIISDYTGQREFLKVIGEDSPVAQQLLKSGNVPKDTLIISGKNLVDVKISSYLAFTPEAKRESVKELLGILPDLPEDVVLDAYGVGNIAEVIKGIKAKRAEEKQMQLEQERMSAEQTQSIENPQSTGQEAFAAIRTLIQGGAPQVPANPGQDYIEAIDQFLARESELGELDSQTLEAIQTFRDQIVQGVGRQAP